MLTFALPRAPSGLVLQRAGSSAASISSVSLQFSGDGLQWHNYLNSLSSTLPPPKVLSPPVPWGRRCNKPLCGDHSHCPQGTFIPLGDSPRFGPLWDIY